MGFLARMTNRLFLMGETMRRSGALDGQKGRNFEREYRRATTACLCCKEGEACRTFLEETAGSKIVPPFCPNRGAFDRMQQF